MAGEAPVLTLDSGGVIFIGALATRVHAGDRRDSRDA